MEPVAKMEQDVLSVSSVNALVRENLQTEPRLQGIWVEGEIFNLTYHSSGHIYFSLKDDRSVLGCTFFRNANTRYRGARLREGMQIMAKGGISVYAPRGNYQLNITQVMLAGEGELRLRIEELKKKLHAEGLFAQSRKRPLPYLPVTVGVATAPTGAAIQDIIRVLRYRHPDVNILLAPCLVQGDDAPQSIVAAIQALSAPELEVDVIIAGRGGGSFEDLLAFNEEIVVRAFADSPVPIISAVGHEIDSPLTDLAADNFAPTPSAAAEQAVPVLATLREHVDECRLRLQNALRNKHRHEKERLHQLFRSRVHSEPTAILDIPSQKLDLLFRDLKSAMREKTRAADTRLRESNLIPVLFEKSLAAAHKRFEIAEERLNNFSPLGTLARGYSVTRNSEKTVIQDAGQTKVDDELEVLLGKGKLTVRVRKIQDEW